jgi:hypothetical protein
MTVYLNSDTARLENEEQWCVAGILGLVTRASYSSPTAPSRELHLYSYNSHSDTLDSLRIATYQYIREITSYRTCIWLLPHSALGCSLCLLFLGPSGMIYLHQNQVKNLIIYTSDYIFRRCLGVTRIRNFRSKEEVPFTDNSYVD